jgi:hypothetical protein
MKRQGGQLYVTAKGAIRLKYFRTEIEHGAEVRKRKDVLLCQIDDRHTAEKRGDRWVFSNAVLSMKDRVMLDVNDRADAFAQPVEKINHRTIAGFYTEVYSEWAFRELRKRTMLLVRGTAAIDIVDGIPPEYLAASRKGVGPDQWDAFEAQVRALYKQMARIKITPLWAKLLDFKTRFPTPIEKLIRRAS